MTFTVHFATRSEAGSPDGFEMVFCGILVIDKTKIVLYEKEDWCRLGDEAGPTFVANFAKIESIKCNKITSRHGNYSGGKLLIVGSFGRPYQECITMKMDFQEFHAVVKELKACFNGRAGLK